MKRRHRDPWARWQDPAYLREAATEYGRAIDRLLPSTVCHERHDPRLPAAQPVRLRS